MQDDFHAKEVATYQNMRHLVNDVKYVQQHILKLFDLLRQVSGDVCDAFPPGGPVATGGASGLIAAAPDAYALPPPVSDGHYSDHIGAQHVAAENSQCGVASF